MATHIVDEVFQDFDAQAERLTGHDQRYIQLSAGVYRGRFLSANLEPVSVHVEYSNQALEQNVGLPKSALTFGVVLSDKAPFQVNGVPFDQENLLIASSGADMHLVSPADGVVVAIVVDFESFLCSPGLVPEKANWLIKQRGSTQVLRLPVLAARIRQDLRLALDSAPANSAQIGQALAASLAAGLSLQKFGGDAATPDSFHRMINSRKAMIQKREIDGSTDIPRRTLQADFARHLSVSPTAFDRLYRLHQARAALIDPSLVETSIGDIASRHGFWDWSRFTKSYRHQFGERPSDRRKALA